MSDALTATATAKTPEAMKAAEKRVRSEKGLNHAHGKSGLFHLLNASPKGRRILKLIYRNFAEAAPQGRREGALA